MRASASPATHAASTAPERAATVRRLPFLYRPATRKNGQIRKPLYRALLIQFTRYQRSIITLLAFRPGLMVRTLRPDRLLVRRRLRSLAMSWNDWMVFCSPTSMTYIVLDQAERYGQSITSTNLFQEYSQLHSGAGAAHPVSHHWMKKSRKVKNRTDIDPMLRNFVARAPSVQLK